MWHVVVGLMWLGSTSFTCCATCQTAQDYCRNVSNIDCPEGKVTLELATWSSWSRGPGGGGYNSTESTNMEKNYLYKSQNDYRTPGLNVEKGNYSPPHNWSCKDGRLITHIHCMYECACRLPAVVSGQTFRSISMDLQPCKGKVPCDLKLTHDQ